MAFRCILSEPGCMIDYGKQGEEHTVLAHFGWDEHEEWDAYLHVGLSPLVGGGMELYFFVLRVDRSTGDVVQHYSGLETRSWLHGEDRKGVRALLSQAVGELICKAEPVLVEGMTHEPDLPDKALAKHEDLWSIFSEQGYEVTRCDPYHGRRVWWAVLPTEDGKR